MRDCVAISAVAKTKSRSPVFRRADHARPPASRTQAETRPLRQGAEQQAMTAPRGQHIVVAEEVDELLQHQDMR